MNGALAHPHWNAIKSPFLGIRFIKYWAALLLGSQNLLDQGEWNNVRWNNSAAGVLNLDYGIWVSVKISVRNHIPATSTCKLHTLLTSVLWVMSEASSLCLLNKNIFHLCLWTCLVKFKFSVKIEQRITGS